MGGYTHPLTATFVAPNKRACKTDLAATIADINVNVLWNQMVWVAELAPW